MSSATVEEASASALQRSALCSRIWMPLAVAFCFAYGILLIALIHTTADGSWFWYASALRHGQHLYRDLHLPMQPLYPIELVLLQRVFGTSWIAQQAVGLVNLLLFLTALAVVIRRAQLSSWQRALLFCCGFLTCMAFIMMRFDDFHIVATSLELFSASILLSLCRSLSGKRVLMHYAALGVLCGICLLIRINDGGLLLCAVTTISFFSGRTIRERLQSVIVVPSIAAAVVLLVILAIGESPRDWWFYSIHTAAAIKGGSSQLIVYPFRLPLGTLSEFTRDWRTLTLTAYTLLIGAVAWTLATRKLTGWIRAAIVLATCLPAIPLARNIAHGNAARVLVALTVLAIYALSALVLVRLVARLRGRAPAEWRPTELLLLIPLAQLVSVSLSAARWYPNTNPPAALMLVLMPVALPWAFRRRPVIAVFFSLAALLTVSAGIDKLRNPFDWFNYRAGSLNVSRVWFQSPAFGPMLIEKQHLALMQPVCSAVDQSAPSDRELLSLPFTYANYFCDVPPWHGYVQTFYDLSDRDRIGHLRNELLSHPPEWIVYERQLDVLSRNEEAFNEGNPLPHRGLDRVIIDKLHSGQWQATVLPAPAGDTSTWFLIHTRPGASTVKSSTPSSAS